MREDSLFSDMVEWVDENNIKQKTSDARQNYLHEFQKYTMKGN